MCIWHAYEIWRFFLVIISYLPTLYSQCGSTAGCRFGEGCHFLHYFPGSHQVVTKMSNLGGPAHPPGRMPDAPLTLTFKTRLCNKYDTAEGCKWGDKCHFAHGEKELSKHIFMNNSMPLYVGPRPTSHFAPPAIPNPGMTSPADRKSVV